MTPAEIQSMLQSQKALFEGWGTQVVDGTRQFIQNIEKTTAALNEIHNEIAKKIPGLTNLIEDTTTIKNKLAAMDPAVNNITPTATKFIPS